MKYAPYLLLLAGLLFFGATYTHIASAAPADENSVQTQAVLAPNAQGCSGTPSIQYAYANPPTINAGQVTTIYWGLVGNASAAFLQFPNGNRQGIGTPGSQQVNPTQTSTYLIIGQCGGVEANIPVTVTVNNAPGCTGTPQLNGFSANPPNIQSGQSTTLSWGPVTNAQYVQLSSQSQGGSGVPAPGSVQVSPSQTTTYFLTAWCQSNSVQAQVTVNVSGAPTPPPPSTGNSVGSISNNTSLTNSTRLIVSAQYFWNGEDAPANLQAFAHNSGGGQIGQSNATRINANANLTANLQFQPYPNGVTNVTVCIIGSSGTELACNSAPMQ